MLENILVLFYHIYIIIFLDVFYSCSFTSSSSEHLLSLTAAGIWANFLVKGKSAS